MSEGGSGVFTITATPAPNQNLTVFYSTTGNAVLGTDYTLSGTAGQVVIPAGQTQATITLTALHDGANEKTEKAKLSLQPNAAYKMPKKTGKSAVMKITNVAP